MNNNQRKLQIGVMGSMADLRYDAAMETLAEEVGFEIAKRGATLLFGAEKDFDSLSTAACRGAKRGGGITVGVTYGKGLEVYEKNVDVVIATGLERGGGRELPLVLSCDAVIAINGGSGTLSEIAIAYQANIPIVALKGSGGWGEKLIGQFLDARKRICIESASSPQEAVTKAIRLASRTFFVGATHGNETIGVNALKQLQQDGVIAQNDWITGNPKAFAQTTRYTETDLNRAFPGNVNGELYEERRAAEILTLAQQYRYAVDIHGTDDNTGIFTIISNPTPANIALAKGFDISNTVLWPSISGRATGPLSQFVRCGIEIECGPQNEERIKDELVRVLKSYLVGAETDREKQYFQVYGNLTGDIPDMTLKSFQETTVNGESFYPLLVNCYPGVKCYKMRSIDPPR